MSFRQYRRRFRKENKIKKKKMIDFKNRVKSATIEALTCLGESVMLGAGV